ncbi:MAG: hypothetical protein ACP5IO_05565 [Elusimicrobiales bacterium]
MRRILCLSIVSFIPLSLFSQNYFDASYTNSSQDFSNYSLSYMRILSTKTAVGIAYIRYGDKDVSSLSRLLFSYFSKGFSLSLSPFYFFPKDGFNFYGAKASFDIIRYGDETVSTYSFYSSYGNEKNSFIDKTIFLGFSFERNYYDEFFIMLHSGIGVEGEGKAGFFNKNILFDSSFLGFINILPYSVLGFSFVRSFKPDFNSYLYIWFDRINSKSNINSYILGLKTYLDDSQNYYADVSFNFADHKSISNEKIWKISVGGSF